MTEKEKLLEYVRFKRMGKTQFEKKAGLANGFFNQGTGLNIRSLARIMKVYNDLNIRWLILGEGEMILNEDPHNKPCSDCKDKQEMIRLLSNQLETVVDEAKKDKELLREIIRRDDNSSKSKHVV